MAMISENASNAEQEITPEKAWGWGLILWKTWKNEEKFILLFFLL